MDYFTEVVAKARFGVSIIEVTKFIKRQMYVCGYLIMKIIHTNYNVANIWWTFYSSLYVYVSVTLRYFGEVTQAKQSPFKWLTHTWWNLIIKMPSCLPCWFSLKSEKEIIWILLNWNWCCNRIYNGILCYDKLLAFSFQRLYEKVTILYMTQLRKTVFRRNDNLSLWSFVACLWHVTTNAKTVCQIITSI